MREALSNLREFPRPQAEPRHRGADRLARILRAGYVAEIIRDSISASPIFHWVVQDAESGEILALGQARSLGEAEVSAVSFLDDLRLRRAI